MQTNITTDKHGREWIRPPPPRYYSHHYERHALSKPTDDFIGKWVAIDAETDFCVTMLWRSKHEAVNKFMRAKSPNAG